MPRAGALPVALLVALVGLPLASGPAADVRADARDGGSVPPRNCPDFRTDAATEAGDVLYRDGHYERAIALWRSQAENGGITAAARLGAALLDGVVTARDLPQAARWLEQAAIGGDLGAQLDIGTLYDNGWGVPLSHATAARWYRRAAVRGDPAGQLNLASMYEHGEGIERDASAAYRWYYAALHGGMGSLASDGLLRVGTALSEAEVRAIVAAAEAEGRARDEAARHGASP